MSQVTVVQLVQLLAPVAFIIFAVAMSLVIKRDGDKARKDICGTKDGVLPMANIDEIYERIKSGKDPEFEARKAREATFCQKMRDLEEESRLHRKTFGPGWAFLGGWVKLDTEGRAFASLSMRERKGETLIEGVLHHGHDDCIATTLCYARTLREARAMVDEALEDIDAWRAKHAEALKVHEG